MYRVGCCVVAGNCVFGGGGNDEDCRNGAVLVPAYLDSGLLRMLKDVEVAAMPERRGACSGLLDLQVPSIVEIVEPESLEFSKGRA